MESERSIPVLEKPKSASVFKSLKKSIIGIFSKKQTQIDPSLQPQNPSITPEAPSHYTVPILEPTLVVNQPTETNPPLSRDQRRAQKTERYLGQTISHVWQG